MANEARITSSLSIQIRDGAIVLQDYNSRPNSFIADVDDGAGPSPGWSCALTEGCEIDLSVLSSPSLCRFQNLDDEDGIVEVGILDPQTSTFYPFCELLPGESYVTRLARNLFSEYGTGAGTGASGPDSNKLWCRALQHDLDLKVEAFNL